MLQQPGRGKQGGERGLEPLLIRKEGWLNCWDHTAAPCETELGPCAMGCSRWSHSPHCAGGAGSYWERCVYRQQGGPAVQAPPGCSHLKKCSNCSQRRPQWPRSVLPPSRDRTETYLGPKVTAAPEPLPGWQDTYTPLRQNPREPTRRV